VGGLEDTVGVNILVASSGDSEGILGLLLVGVDVLVAEAELAKLVLGVELAGGSGGNGNGSNRGNGGNGDRGGGRFDNLHRGRSGMESRVDDLNWGRGRGNNLHNRGRGSMDKRSRGSMDKRSRGRMDKRGGLDHTDRGRVNKDGSGRDFIIALDGFSLTLLPLNNHSVSGIGMGQKVSSAGSGNLRGFSDRGGGSNDGDFRGDREVGDGDGEVSGRNSESIDGV